MNFLKTLKKGLKIQGFNDPEILVNIYCEDELTFPLSSILYENKDALVIVPTHVSEEIKVIPKDRILYVEQIYGTWDDIYDELDELDRQYDERNETMFN